MNFSDIIDTSIILDEAFKHPAMRVRASRKASDGVYRPDTDTALKCVLNTIEEEVITAIAVKAAGKIEEEYRTYSDMMQDCTAPAMGDDYQAFWDELVESAITEFVPVLSQDWLGKNLIDVPQDVKEFTLKLGREYYKQLTYAKTPAQIMSSAGVLKIAVEERLKTHNNPTDKETDNMASEYEKEFEDVVNKIAAHVGKDFDIMAVYNDVDLASEDDDLLAGGAAARLGINAEDIDTLRGARLVHGDELMDVVNKAVETAQAGKKGKKGLFGREIKEKAPALPVTGSKPPVVKPEKPAKAPKAVPEADEKEGDLNPSVLTALKECGAGDADMAKGLGVSRATHNNYVNAKTALSPSAEQYGFIRDLIVTKLNVLHEALAELDGTEAHVVF